MSDSADKFDAVDVTPLSILAIDDDQDFREYIHGELSQTGHAVRTVSNPKQLISEVENNRPDVVLLDMNMGASTGEQVLAEIRKRWPNLCVIVITGYPSLDSMRNTFKQDVYDYITKPFKIEDLHRALAQATQTFGLGRHPMDRLRSVLGRQIRLARTERGWTLRELSEVSSVSVSQLSSIERGTHLPSIESLIAISVALGTNASNWFASAGF